MKQALIVLFLIVFSVTLYGLTIRGSYGNPNPTNIKQNWDGNGKPFELSPERGRFAHVMTLADTGQYALTQQMADFVYPDVGYYNGQYFSFFAPGVSYLALPFYEFGSKYNLSQVATFGFVGLVSVMALILIFAIARDILKLSPWASLLAALIFAFSSTSWSYSTTLYQHMFSVLFILLGFYSAWKYSQREKFSWAWGGFVWLAYALAFFVDYPNLFLMLPVMVYFLVNALSIHNTEKSFKVSLRTSLILTSIIFVIITGLHLFHNQYYYGSWHRLSGSLVGVKTIEEIGADNKPTDQINSAVQSEQQSKDNVVKFFTEQNVPHSPYVLLLSTERGLFVFCPIFILSIWGFAVACKRNKNLEIGTLLAVVLCNVFLYSSWGDPWGGWAYGPRYLIISMSVLSLFVAYFISYSKLNRFWKFIIAAPLILYSSAIAVLGVITSNSIPPKVEAIPLHTGYNFLRNLQFLDINKGNNFIYNTYVTGSLSLFQYGLILWVVVVIVLLLVLILSMQRRENV